VRYQSLTLDPPLVKDLSALRSNLERCPSSRGGHHHAAVLPSRESSKAAQLGCHRIIECFGLEGTFRGHLAQPPCSEQGHLQLNQVAQSPVQPGLERFQGWAISHRSGQPVPGFHHPQCKKFLPYMQSKSTLFGLKPLPLVPSQPALKNQTSSFL